MKSKNKLKLFATAAGLAAVAAPIITLASCNKGGAPIVIDEKEKVKELEKGCREATFTFQLSSAIQVADSIKVELKDIVSSKTGFTVMKSAEPEYETGSKEVKQKIMIAPEETTDAIVPEGTSVTFNVEIKRLNGKGEQTAAVTIKDFKMTYVAPVSEGLTLEGNKVSACNPGYGQKTAQHTFQFAIGSSISIDEETTYEVELTKLDTSTSGVDVKYVEAKYDKVNNKLRVTFEMSKATTLSEDDQVNFDFTISASKEGTELWRQSFSGYGIWYLSRHMYIFNEDQQERNLAGQNKVYLFIATTENLEWNKAPYNAKVTISSITPTGTTLTYNDADVTKQQGEDYWYFIVPLTIGGTLPADGTTIKYNARLSATVDGQTVTDDFEGMSFTYVTKKIDETGAVKTGVTLGDQKYYDFKLPLVDFYAQTSIECGLIPKTVPAGTTVTAGAVGMVSDCAWPRIFVETNSKEVTGEFSLVLQGYKAGKVVWTEYIDNFKLTYIDPIDITTKSIETGKETADAEFAYTVTTPTGATITPTTANYQNLVTGRNVQDVTIYTPASNKIKATLNPVSSKELSYESYATFDLQIAGKYTVSGNDTNWTKVIKGCRVDYFGTLEYDESCPRSQIAEPGTNLVCYEFNRKVKASQIDDILVTTDQSSSTRRKAKFHGWSETEDKYLVWINMESTQPEGDPLQDGDQVKFSIKFTGKSPLGTTWEKIFGTGTGTDTAFQMTYTSPVTAETKEISTLPKQNKAYITLKANKALGSNEYYKVRVTDQQRPDLIVSVNETEKRTPAETTFKVEATLTKTGSPLAKGDFTKFGIAVDKYTDDVVTETSFITPFTVTYTDAYIKWNENDWYVYENKSVESQTCGYGNVRFELSKELEPGQQILVTATNPTGDYVLEPEAATVSGTTVTVPMRLKPTGFVTQMYIGKTAKANLKIDCVESTTTVWTETITDFELYMLSSFTASTQAITTTSTSATLTVNMTAEIASGSSITLFARCKKVASSKENLDVVYKSASTSGSQLRIVVNFAGSATPAKDDYVTFDVDVIARIEKGGSFAMVTVPMLSGPVKLTKTA